MDQTITFPDADVTPNSHDSPLSLVARSGFVGDLRIRDRRPAAPAESDERQRHRRSN